MPRVTYGGIFGSKVLASVSQLQQVKATLARAKAVADEMTASPNSPTALEGSAEFNVQSGGGTTFYNDLATLVAGFTTSEIAALTDLDQG